MNDDLQHLAVLQWLYNEIGKEVGTRSSDGLRAKEDAALLARYAEDGTDRRRIIINDEEVGTLSVRFAKEHPRYIVEEADKVADWMAEPEHRALLVQLLREKGQGIIDWYAGMLDGEVPDGCTAYIEPRRPNGTLLKIDQERIAAALGIGLPQAVDYALPDGDEE